jgi:CRP-like cAMP-binding protein/Zn-dependent protease
VGELLLVLAAVMGVIVVVGGAAAARRRASRSIPLDEAIRVAPRGETDVERLIAGRLVTSCGQFSHATDVWSVLATRVDLARFQPKLASDVEVRIFRLRWGNDYAMAFNPREFKHYSLEVWEAELLPLMDGSRSVGELVVERLGASGSIDADGVTELVLGLREHGYFDPPTPNLGTAVERHLRSTSGLVDSLARALRTLRIEWSGADRFVRILYRGGLRYLFAPSSVVVTMIVAVVGLAAFLRVATWGRFSIDAAAAPSEAAVLIVLGGILTFAHELGHALVITHHGRRIGGAGFMLYFGSPAFFVDASDSLMLDRRARMAQSGMGPFFELVLAGFASIVLFAFPDLAAAPLLYRFALINYFVILLNLVPLLELDGYWLLADAIQVPDLRPRSLQFTRHDLWHKLRARERFSLQELGLAAYGLIGVAFTIVSLVTAAFFWQIIFGGIVAELWAQGTATRLLLVVFVLLFAGPAIRGAITLTRAVARRAGAAVRRVRFRFETSWRIEAAELIDALSAFQDLPVATLNDLAGRVQLRHLAAGEPVFRQGDRADAFYVVRRGLIHIEQEHPETGDVAILATLRRGESFGELGLLSVAPRAATARADAETELFMVDKSAFDHLLAAEMELPSFGPTLQSLAELRALPPFRHLGTEPLAELLTHGGWVTAAPGTELVRQGAPGDAFYVIASGQADVVRDGERIAHLGAGDHFGELALIGNEPRVASVVATTPMRAFRLEREGFDRVILEAFDRGDLRPHVERTWEH